MNQLIKKKMSQISEKKKKGFTLIELIIVIAIIAILAAIALPKFGAAKHNADVAADQANAKIIATAVATAIANGEIDEDATSIDTDDITPYIDGHTMPDAKIGDFSITYSKANGVRISNDDGLVYPVS
ncbi:prepilin-type N-terminal cleavage/methylation domain-containing protein [Clostridium beijerinckii]|uniref:Fimbrial protein n=1 Tax=Clostridium beijerinckii TaxID=1520 RepID=A0A1S9NCL7_CLOBE|nr:prepilin-type N-terminal cleavage/methylation domain-containing protein [Clostridium beijerinckii]MZK51677.1 prepilin-type N-terminal cleavage/methylation domain-containing protein [Clostridium beijerinckii]MZK60420.1 prepilin-type N-terminal cleavage/methylation domain-containing protein [Clostridium beijerinckii]MZK70237.1 prepilin-type N-terminal cleavage/methylation domain-containing protein [Clostridium beijerinckii]MZK75480.1 prepilin-type N-terminal cleavage/methylation domain-contain